LCHAPQPIRRRPAHVRPAGRRDPRRAIARDSLRGTNCGSPGSWIADTADHPCLHESIGAGGGSGLRVSRVMNLGAHRLFLIATSAYIKEQYAASCRSARLARAGRRPSQRRRLAPPRPRRCRTMGRGRLRPVRTYRRLTTVLLERYALVPAGAGIVAAGRNRPMSYRTARAGFTQSLPSPCCHRRGEHDSLVGAGVDSRGTR
jgi:hypothetical protein